jgi:hypothetical protein
LRPPSADGRRAKTIEPLRARRPCGALTDQQLSAVYAAAQPLDVAGRAAFLQAVAVALSNRPDPGDGDVHRAAREAQRRFFAPPLDTAHAPAPLRKIGR